MHVCAVEAPQLAAALFASTSSTSELLVSPPPPMPPPQSVMPTASPSKEPNSACFRQRDTLEAAAANYASAFSSALVDVARAHAKRRHDLITTRHAEALQCAKVRTAQWLADLQVAAEAMQARAVQRWTMEERPEAIAAAKASTEQQWIRVGQVGGGRMTSSCWARAISRLITLTAITKRPSRIMDAARAGLKGY